MNKSLLAQILLAVCGILICFVAYLVATDDVYLTKDLDGLRSEWNEYSVTIERDAESFPYITGKRNVDVAFGFGYAQAESAILELEHLVLQARGNLALKLGESSASNDRAIRALSVYRAAEEAINSSEKGLSMEARAYAKAFATGINYFAWKNPNSVTGWVYPITAVDVAAVMHLRHLEKTQILSLYQQLTQKHWDAENLPQRNKHAVNQSYAVAIGPGKGWGNTILMSGHYGPFEGGRTWYRAHLKSDEGLDLRGATYLGFPVLVSSVRKQLTWTALDNNPLVYDLYTMETTGVGEDLRFRSESLLHKFHSEQIDVSYLMALDITRTASSQQQMAFDDLVFSSVDAASGRTVYAGLSFSRIAQADELDQWLALNLASTYQEWYDGLTLQTIPTMTFVFADAEGQTAAYYNAALHASALSPNKLEPQLEHQLLPVELKKLPNIVNPASGFIAVANQTPLRMTAVGDLQGADYTDADFGLESGMNNRAHIILERMSRSGALTVQQLLDLRGSLAYSQKYPPIQKILALTTNDYSYDAKLSDAQTALASWNLQADGPSSSLAICLFVEMGKQHPHLTELEETVETQLLRSCSERVASGDQQVSRLFRAYKQVGDRLVDFRGAPDTMKHIEYRHRNKKDVVHVAENYSVLVQWDRKGQQQIKEFIQVNNASDATNIDEAEQKTYLDEGMHDYSFEKNDVQTLIRLPINAVN